MADEIYEIIRECLEGKHKTRFRYPDLKMLKEQNVVSLTVINAVLRNRHSLIRKLEANNEKRNAISVAFRLIEMMVRHGILIQKERGTKRFVGIMK